jgi:hypothetical protein
MRGGPDCNVTLSIIERDRKSEQVPMITSVAVRLRVSPMRGDGLYGKTIARFALSMRNSAC